MVEHLLSIFSSLLIYLPGESASRIRTLAKFMEKDYEKTKKIVELRLRYAARVRAVDEGIAKERRGMSKEEVEFMEAAWLSRRLEHGLFSLQTIDIILAWLVAEDEAAKKTIKEALGDKDEGLDVVRKTLEGEYLQLLQDFPVPLCCIF